VSFHRARAERFGRRTGLRPPTAVGSREAVLLRREETFAARHLGPLAIANAAGALLFCGVVIKEGVNVNRGEAVDAGAADTSVDPYTSHDIDLDHTPSATDADMGAVAISSAASPNLDRIDNSGAAGPSTTARIFAVGLALLTAVGVVVSAKRLTSCRLIELRILPGDNAVVRIYTRTMAGGNSLALAREAPPSRVAVDFGRLRAAATERQNDLIRKNSSAVAKTAASKSRSRPIDVGNHPAFFSFSLLQPEGDQATRPNEVYTVDARQLSVLDVQAIERHAVDSRTVGCSAS
jgi:hypothetical protein